MQVNCKKGFTLIELLSTVVIISMLFGIGIPGISKIKANMDKKAYATKVDLVERAGELWGQDNKALLQSTTCVIDGKNINCYKAPVDYLICEGYLDSEAKKDLVYSDPTNKEAEYGLLDNCVYVYKKNNRVYSKFSTDTTCSIKIKNTSVNNSGDDINICKTE